MIEDMKAIIEEFEKETGIKVVGERGEFFYKKFAKWLKAKVESLTKEKTEIAKLLREDELCLANKDEEIESLQDEVERLKYEKQEACTELDKLLKRISDNAEQDAIEDDKYDAMESELSELKQKINDGPKAWINDTDLKHASNFKDIKLFKNQSDVHRYTGDTAVKIALLEIDKEMK